MRIVIYLMLAMALNATPVTKAYQELKHLTLHQKRVLFTVYQKAHQFNLGYTMAAIAWQESDFGKYPMNVSDGKDGSYGVFHNLLSSVCSRHPCTSWGKSRLAERLIFDLDFSFAEALSELKFWQNYWKAKKVPRVWSHMICSYNAGYRWKNGSKYRKMIIVKIKALQIFMKGKM